MSLYKEQLKENGYPSITAGKGKRWVKRQYNKHIRRESKNIHNSHPKTNRYRGWVD